VPTEQVARLANLDSSEVTRLLEQLAVAGFVERSNPVEAAGRGGVRWCATLRGGALANASFLKPIARAKAQVLLNGVLERAAAYNADPGKPLWIERISVFGSFLNPDATDFGDIDLNVILVDREPDDPHARNRYSRATRRRFRNIVEELAWPGIEARRILKNRSGYISIHQEDIARFTDRSDVVFERVPRAVTG
jgi:predicted nucleotidyltransferase